MKTKEADRNRAGRRAEKKKEKKKKKDNKKNEIPLCEILLALASVNR